MRSSDTANPAIVAATIIDGGGSGSLVNFIEGDTSTLKGFTIRNGNRLGYGGGIYIRESSPIITGNTITGNEFLVNEHDDPPDYTKGAHVYFN